MKTPRVLEPVIMYISSKNILITLLHILLKERLILKSDIQHFFENYQNALEQYNFQKKFIWNCDETMLKGGTSRKKFVCEKGAPAAVSIDTNTSEHITLLLFTSQFAPVVCSPYYGSSFF